MEGIYHDADLKDSPVSEKKTVVDSPNIAQTSDFSNLPINLQLDSEEKIRLYSQMVRIRRFEERSLRAYQQGHIGGFFTPLHRAGGSCSWVGFSDV